MDIQFIQKVALCCYYLLQAASEPETDNFYSRTHFYAALMLYFDNQRALGVVGFPFSKCLDVGPFLWSYVNSLIGNKAAILHREMRE